MLQQADLKGAAAVFRDAIRLQPRNAEAWYNLGVALKQQDDLVGAREALQKAIDF